MTTTTSRRSAALWILAPGAVLVGVLASTAPAVDTESPATVPATLAVTARAEPSDPRLFSEERHAWARRMSAARRELVALRAAARDVAAIRDSVRDRIQLLEWVSAGHVPVEALGPAQGPRDQTS